MTRRTLLLAAIGASPLLAAKHATSHVNEHEDAPKTPRNELAWASNDFTEQHMAWAKSMKGTVSGGIVPAPAVEAFQPLPDLWRQVERKFRTWLRGY